MLLSSYKTKQFCCKSLIIAHAIMDVSCMYIYAYPQKTVMMKQTHAAALCSAAATDAILSRIAKEKLPLIT